MRFFDGGLPDEPADRDAVARVFLERRMEEGEEAFAMLRRIGYDDRRLGPLLVPADPATFRTDLTSVPRFFTWLVPRSGRHLPAALVHDGLVETDPALPPTYVSPEGVVVTRVQADRVFRDAMADLGVPPVRRWLVWSAVTVATMVDGRATGWGPVRRWWFRGVAVLTLAVTLVLGVLATLDLAGAGLGVPWIGDGPTGLRLLQGVAAAVVLPCLLALLWGRFVVAGLVTNVALALLLHLTAALVATYLLYAALEALVRGASRAVD
ncbi:DUF1353 domain-containing protein [uncultured Nocardioides sp.]|uniref:DUF1353 domain-containing protein n=1 Tax=uncultured Nocardioides sp. TaxID=198441 RepID=UPI002631CAE7|nr:DUF1353 domain-containing protein [uncultured Nocardioides sp.]